MSCEVFIEQHLESYLKNLAENYKQAYIPGVIVGQVIGKNYYVVHLAPLPRGDYIDEMSIMTYEDSHDVFSNSELLFENALQIVNLLPGGSHVLGVFFIVPQGITSFQPMNIDFNELNKQLNKRLPYNGNKICNETGKTWDYLLLNYSTIKKKLLCYTVDFKRSKSPKVTSFKSIGYVFESLDNDWVTLVGTFNVGSLGWFNASGGPRALLSIQEDLFNKFELILNGSVITFNGCVCDENKILKDFEYHTIGDVLNNVVDIELFKEVDLGNECKNASLKVERGKGRVMMSGLCSIAVPFNRNGSIKDAIKAIYEDVIHTLAIRLKMHLESMVGEESLDEGTEANVEHETPRRILILKTEGSKFAFSDYVFPGRSNPQETFIVAREILFLSKEKIELYNELEKGRYSLYEELPDIDSRPPLDAITESCSNNNGFIYFIVVSLLLAILAYVIKQFFI